MTLDHALGDLNEMLEIAPGTMLIMDNCPAHTIGVIQATCDQWMTSCPRFPPLSPELMPVENVIGLLKRKVTAVCEKEPPATADQLLDCVKAAAGGIDVEVVNRTIRAQVQRARWCTAANGARFDEHTGEFKGGVESPAQRAARLARRGRHGPRKRDNIGSPLLDERSSPQPRQLRKPRKSRRGGKEPA